MAGSRRSRRYRGGSWRVCSTIEGGARASPRALRLRPAQALRRRRRGRRNFVPGGPERDRRSARPQRRGEDDHHRHAPRRSRADLRRHPDRRRRPPARPVARDRADELRGRLRPPAGQPHRRPEPPRVRPSLRRDGAVVGRADARLPGQGDAEPPEAAAARRADRLARPLGGPGGAREDPLAGDRGPGRRSLDLAQHGRGRTGLRPRPLPVARQDPARRGPEGAAGRARPAQPRGALRRRRQRTPPARMMPLRLRRSGAIVLRQLYLVRGSVARALPLFAWVAVDVVLWGFITKYLNTFARAGYDFVPVLLGAVLLWDFLGRVMQGVTMAFLEDVWSRNFLNVFATPITIGEYVAGLVASSIATSVIGLGVMVVLAGALFGLSVSVYGAAFAPFLLLLFTFGVALGIFGSALVLRLGPASEWFVWPIPALLSPFAGVFYPLSTLPPWARVIGYALPPAYVFEGMRDVLAHGSLSPTPLLGGGALALAYLALASWFFVRVHRYAVRTGLIARYSAETVS